MCSAGQGREYLPTLIFASIGSPKMMNGDHPSDLFKYAIFALLKPPASLTGRPSSTSLII